eukprot:TRINITY_DN22136_c0_g1_i2.p1 TRINITY_DN22136_c0_g1~~TRINITY_DN22136_c0_g1_i2.p1  ORF type:complete len:190 (-),score=43.78 TRINITY_DN22136_c0_g1_i2:77-646(-)
MKIVTLLVLLAVVRQCYSVHKEFALLIQTSYGLFQALEARNHPAALTSAERLYKEISDYKLNVQGFDHRKLEEYGYKFVDCYNSLHRLENVAKTLLADIKSRRQDPTAYDRRSTSELIFKTYSHCRISSDILDSMLKKNGDRPDCKDALQKYTQRVNQIHEKDVLGARKQERDALLMALYIACGNPSRK